MKNLIGVGLVLRSWGAVFVLLLASFAVYGYGIHAGENGLGDLA